MFTQIVTKLLSFFTIYKKSLKFNKNIPKSKLEEETVLTYGRK